MVRITSENACPLHLHKTAHTHACTTIIRAPTSEPPRTPRTRFLPQKKTVEQLLHSDRRSHAFVMNNCLCRPSSLARSPSLVVVWFTHLLNIFFACTTKYRAEQRKNKQPMNNSNIQIHLLFALFHLCLAPLDADYTFMLIQRTRMYV